MSNTGWFFGKVGFAQSASAAASAQTAIFTATGKAGAAAATIVARPGTVGTITFGVAEAALAFVSLSGSIAPPVTTDPATVTQMYLPAYYAFYIHTGDICRKRVQYRVQGTPIGLPAGCTVEWRFTMPDSSVFIASETSGHLTVDRSTGMIRLTLDGADTALLAGLGRHSLKVIGTRIKTLLAGDLVVTR